MCSLELIASYEGMCVNGCPVQSTFKFPIDMCAIKKKMKGE